MLNSTLIKSRIKFNIIIYLLNSLDYGYIDFEGNPNIDVNNVAFYFNFINIYYDPSQTS